VPTGPSQSASFENDVDRFHLLVDAVTDYAIYLLDRDGRVASWNVGAERLKGYSAAEAIGQPYWRFFSEEDQHSKLPARLLAEVREKGRLEVEGWRVRKDRSRFFAFAVIHKVEDARGRHIGFAQVTRDITERRAAQEKLKASERLFRLLVNGVTDYALFMLDLNGVVTSWNAGAERIKGYAAPEIIGQHFSRFYTATDRAAGVPARALQTAAAEGRFEAEGWRVRKDGKPFWANVVIDPIRDDDGRLIGYCKITRDITERRQAQQSMQEAQTRMAQLQKMEALGQLTGGVAHDFNNMLMVISGFVPRLKEAAAHDPRAVRAADAIELAVQRSAALTRQLLSFSRRQSLRPAVVILPEAIEAARPIIASLLGSSVEYVTAVLPETWPVLVDVSELELAIVNLSVNARDAMPGGGTVAITADNLRLAGEVGDLEGEFVALTLADTGAGMPPDILARAFDPFFTTKEEGKGTGLGLSQVDGFVHQSGGSVVIKSDVGQGTRVTLYLPRATGETAAAMPADAPDGLPRGRSVLLVEDNPDVAEVTRDLLERMECGAEIVRDADTALQRLGEKGFDIVLSDIVMAGPMNGLGLARLVRERWPHVRVVLATGYSEAAAEAAKDFIVLRKPYKVEDLDWAFAQPVPARANIVAFQDTRHGRQADDRGR
jgi:PAS domain S-box-containing protein